MLRTLSAETESQRLARARAQLADLFRPDPRRFWAELIGTGLVGWSAMLLAINGLGGWPVTLVLTIIATLAMHRSTAFLHELTHLNDRAVPMIRRGWNLVWGLPFLLPSWLYERVHLEHHRRRLYGTSVDPEYMPLAGKPPLRIVLSASFGLLLPIALVLRFMALSPLAWVWPRASRVIEARFSSLAWNMKWVAPEPTPLQRQRMRIDEALCFVWAWSLVALVVGQVLPLSALVVPLSMSFGAVLCNQLRGHAAHRFVSDGSPYDEVAILSDSLNVEPKNALERLLMPLGVGLHALHHVAPAIPFHNLQRAHRRVLRLMPMSSPYHHATVRGLGRCWVALLVGQ